MVKRSSSQLAIDAFGSIIAWDLSGLPQVSLSQSIGLEMSAYGTHSMRRTKLESTVRDLGIEIDDALRIAEQIEL